MRPVLYSAVFVFVTIYLFLELLVWVAGLLENPMVRMTVLALCILLVVADEIDGKQKREIRALKANARYAPRETVRTKRFRVRRREGSEEIGYREMEEVGWMEETIVERFRNEAVPQLRSRDAGGGIRRLFSSRTGGGNRE